MSTPDLSKAMWRKSSFSAQDGSCVEVTTLGDGRIAVRDSKQPEGGTVLLGQTAMTAYVQGVKDGRFSPAVAG